MGSFSQEMAKALNLLPHTKIKSAARGGLKKNRKKFVYSLATFLKKETKLRRTVQKIADRLGFKPNPRAYDGGVVDNIFISNTQFSFLAFPHKIKQKRRKSGSFSSARALESVNVGKGFKKYDGVFVARGKNNNLLPFRRKNPSDNRSKLKSMQVNSYNMIVNNSDKFNNWSSDYSIAVATEMGKRMIRAMARQVNKKVKFKIDKG